MNATQQEFLDDFSSLQDEFERYTYLTYLGNQLGLPDPSLKTDKLMVKGCQSETWVRLSCSHGRLSLEAYSDALVVRGLLFILRESMQGMCLSDFSKNEFLLLYEQAGLSSLLAESRRSGLSSILDMVDKQVQLSCYSNL